MSTTNQATTRHNHESDVMTRRLAHTAAKPIEAPVRHTDHDWDELRAEVDMAAKRGHDANKRLKLHLVFVSCGIILNVGITFANMAIVLHFGAVLVGAPSVLYEFTDWIRGW